MSVHPADLEAIWRYCYYSGVWAPGGEDTRIYTWQGSITLATAINPKTAFWIYMVIEGDAIDEDAWDGWVVRDTRLLRFEHGRERLKAIAVSPEAAQALLMAIYMRKLL